METGGMETEHQARNEMEWKPSIEHSIWNEIYTQSRGNAYVVSAVDLAVSSSAADSREKNNNQNKKKMGNQCHNCTRKETGNLSLEEEERREQRLGEDNRSMPDEVVLIVAQAFSLPLRRDGSDMIGLSVISSGTDVHPSSAAEARRGDAVRFPARLLDVCEWTR
ncbi:hypothetical protein ACLOJK_026920 [Asimina triloba]